jgi:TDG/mug DNA glycosylase family protein
MGRQDDTIGGRPVWVLPNPSALNAHHPPADFARLYAEGRAPVESPNLLASTLSPQGGARRACVGDARWTACS